MYCECFLNSVFILSTSFNHLNLAESSRYEIQSEITYRALPWVPVRFYPAVPEKDLQWVLGLHYKIYCHSVCPHCKHLDTFEFLCVVQVKRSIALHNRKLKSRGINLFQLAPSCRKEVAYRLGRIFIDQNKNILTAKSELAYTVYRRGLRLV